MNTLAKQLPVTSAVTKFTPALWAKVESLLVEHPTMKAEDIATLAKCGVVTVYRIKRKTSV